MSRTVGDLWTNAAPRPFATARRSARGRFARVHDAELFRESAETLDRGHLDLYPRAQVIVDSLERVGEAGEPGADGCNRPMGSRDTQGSRPRSPRSPDPPRARRASDARCGPGGALRRADAAARSRREAEREALLARLHVPADNTRARRFEVPNWHLKTWTRWAPHFPVRVHRARGLSHQSCTMGKKPRGHARERRYRSSKRSRTTAMSSLGPQPRAAHSRVKYCQ
jgi:hypothetical protein